MKHYRYYTDLLIILAIILVVGSFVWGVILFVLDQPKSVITISTDGPEMQKATKLIMDQLERERK